ncbi:MAG: hypothetical protein KAY24_03990 [Candidatus Eisenbacteria sp.]|nr:hypothetical protein [Candidatus Eisenbacteria bacterium]
MEFDLDRVYLTLDGVTIDDDMLGASYGDGDGVIEFDETIELTLALHNLGHVDAYDVTAGITTGSSFVGLCVSEVSFGDILSGETVASDEPFVFHVTRDVPNGDVIAFTVEISEEPGLLGLDFEVLAPMYHVGIVDIDDTGGGNGNGIPDPGETVEITLMVSNVGGTDSPDLEAVLGTASDFFIPDGTPHPLGVLAVGQSVTPGAFTVEVSAACPPIYTHNLRLVLSGPNHYCAPVPFIFSVGEIFADDMEEGTAFWTHYAGQGSWLDEWHLETHRNHTPGGESSWKCGGAGSVPYTTLLYSILQTIEFDLPAGCHLRFWHWIDAETSVTYPDYCYDGGLMEITLEGGWSWLPLTPEGGYPYLIRDGATPGPFAAETPVWSGQQGWTEVIVDLSAYEGPIMLRWAFGSDGADVREGWYIDDVRICMTPPAAVEPGSDDAQVIIRPLLFPACPNPVTMNSAAGCGASDVVLRFALPEPAEGKLMLFDTSGRLIRVLASGTFEPGQHQITWNGRNAAGRQVNAGGYFYRLSVNGASQTQRLIVVR